MKPSAAKQVQNSIRGTFCDNALYKLTFTFYITKIQIPIYTNYFYKCNRRL